MSRPTADISHRWEGRRLVRAPVVGLPDETERIELSDEGCITVAQVLNVLLR